MTSFTGRIAPAPAQVGDTWVDGTGSIASFGPFGWQRDMTLVAQTSLAGVADINGTQDYLTWTAPNDGQLHRALFFAVLVVTSTQTGGGVSISGANPTFGPTTVITGAHAAGQFLLGFGSGIAGSILGAIVQPGQTIKISQAAALTGGASGVIAEIWAS